MSSLLAALPAPPLGENQECGRRSASAIPAWLAAPAVRRPAEDALGPEGRFVDREVGTDLQHRFHHSRPHPASTSFSNRRWVSSVLYRMTPLSPMSGEVRPREVARRAARAIAS